MSVETKHERVYDDKDSYTTGALSSSTTEPHTNDGTTLTAKNGNQHLQLPFTTPVRPLSPDTISNLSVEEYNQLHDHDYIDDSEDDVPKPQHRTKLQAFWIRNKGLAYLVVAQVFGTLMNVTIRLLEVEGNHGNGMHPVQVIFARMTITMLLASAYMWWAKTPDFPFGKPEVRWLLVARGFGGFFGVFGMYYSLLYLPLSDTTVLTFLAPSLACWACSILINEPFTRKEQIAAAISMVGVVLIARPTSLFQTDSPAVGVDEIVSGVNATLSTRSDASNYDNVTPTQRLAAVGVSLLGVLGAATAYTTIRWIGKRAHPLISVNYFSVWCFFVSLVAQVVLPGVGFLLPATLKDWAYLIFLGVCGFIMQFLLAAGLSYEKSSRGTNIAYTQMLFALAFDKLFFGHVPGWISIVGSSLVLGPAIWVALSKDTGSVKQSTSGISTTDEESQRGLISGVSNESHSIQGLPPVEEVQLRVLK